MVTSQERLTYAFPAEYMATPSDNTIRENVEADRTFLCLNTLTVTPRLLSCLRWPTCTKKLSEFTYRQFGLHPFGLKFTDLSPHFVNEFFTKRFDGLLDLRISSSSTRCFRTLLAFAYQGRVVAYLAQTKQQDKHCRGMINYELIAASVCDLP